jgi:DNA mismatch repair protein MutL
MVPVQESTPILDISGFIGKPKIARKSRGHQFFFLNGRFIRHPYLHHALVTGYHELLPEGNQPAYLIFLTIDPRRVDVNVHPAKTEVKIDDEKTNYAILMSAVRRALSQYQVAPALDFSMEPGLSWTSETHSKGGGKTSGSGSGSGRDTGAGSGMGTGSTQNPDSNAGHSGLPNNGNMRSPFNPAYNPFTDGKRAAHPSDDSWRRLLEVQLPPRQTEPIQLFPNTESCEESTPHSIDSMPGNFPGGVFEQPLNGRLENPEEESYTDAVVHDGAKTGGSGMDKNEWQYSATSETGLFQLHQRYVVGTLRSGLLIVDQEVAHYRILFDRFQMRLTSGTGASQQCIFPTTLQLRADEELALIRLDPILRAAGFDWIAGDAPLEIRLTGHPADIDLPDPENLFHELLCDEYPGSGDALASIREQLARVMARRSHIRVGKSLSPIQMRQLVDELFACKNPYYSPDGLPVLLTITIPEIMQRLGGPS